jgi:hypothetical protein
MAIIVLSLAIFAAFWSQNAWPIYWLGDRGPNGFGHSRLSLSRSFDPRPKGWLQWTSDEGNDGRRHAPAYLREPLDGDDTELRNSCRGGGLCT